MTRIKYWDEKSQTWKYADDGRGGGGVDLAGYATKEYVRKIISEAALSGGSISVVPEGDALIITTSMGVTTDGDAIIIGGV